MKSKHTLLALTLTTGFAISSANAAITLNASSAATGTATPVSPFTSVTLSSFNALASDKLVVLAGAASGGSSAIAITSVTYNGVAMILATQGSTTESGFRTTGIYYLDKASFPGTAGNIVVNFSRSIFTSNGYHIGAFALSGTQTGFDAGSSNIGTGTNGTSATINVAQAGSFVAAVNSYGNLGAPAGMTEISAADSLNRAYQLNVAAGSFTANFGGGQVTSVASFAPIPEPSSALLGGLGLLVLLRRRR